MARLWASATFLEIVKPVAEIPSISKVQIHLIVKNFSINQKNVAITKKKSQTSETLKYFREFQDRDFSRSTKVYWIFYGSRQRTETFWISQNYSTLFGVSKDEL